MKILSLFDGMSCGAIALTELDIPINRYVAYEIDQHAVKLSAHNFSLEVEHRGDVFDADFSEFEGFDFLMGGSPCTYWSIAQSPDKRETTSSGIGWELFSQYVRALNEANPKYFIYENNKSMSAEIRRSISETFGFEPILINSALVSAQNRNRLYWVGKRNDQGGYDKVNIEQPDDRGILLKDILDNENTIVFDSHSGGVPCGESRNKSYTITARHGSGFTSFRGYNACLTPICTQGEKSQTLKAQYGKNSAQNGVEGGRTHGATMVAEPTCVAQRGRYSDTGNRHVKSDGVVEQHFEARDDGKTNTLTTVQKDNHVAEPLRVGDVPNSEGHISGSQANRVYSEDAKSVNLVANGGGGGAKTGLYAVTEPSKHPRAYEVKNGQITIEIKGEPRTYPIKLADGFYIIRKLTVAECARLQTVPDWYDFTPISNTQAYKCLGNGWTVEVIMHIIRACLAM